MQAAVLVPVGPGAAEMARLADLADSLQAYEPGVGRVLLVDDAPRRRDLRAALGPLADRAEVLRTGTWDRRTPTPYEAMTAGTMAGLRRAAELDAGFLVKLDTDALVVAPFIEPIERAFDADPGLGLVGSYDRTIAGHRRDWATWSAPIAHACRRRPSARDPRGRRSPAWWLRIGARARRRHVRTALAHGYEMGEHCLGGAYAVSSAFLRRLDRDSAAWIATEVSEDVVVGLLNRAAGLGAAGLIGPDEPFALSHVGLPGPIDALLDRGHSIVHSVRNDPWISEQELRGQLARRRAVRARPG